MVGSGNVGVVVAYQMLQGRMPGGGGHRRRARDRRIRGPRGQGGPSGRALPDVPHGQGGPGRGTGWRPRCWSNWMRSGIRSRVRKRLWRWIPSVWPLGLNPTTNLARMAGCKMAFVPALGGNVPAHDHSQETSVPGLFVAGDVSGIEEASSAIVGGAAGRSGRGPVPGLPGRGRVQGQARKRTWRPCPDCGAGLSAEKRRQGKEAMMAALEG